MVGRSAYYYRAVQILSEIYNGNYISCFTAKHSNAAFIHRDEWLYIFIKTLNVPKRYTQLAVLECETLHCYGSVALQWEYYYCHSIVRRLWDDGRGKESSSGCPSNSH